MKISVSTQLVQICLCGLLGLASGFLYDAFKVLRRESKSKALPAFLDALFCFVVCFALFIAGMRAGRGSLGLFMLAFAFIGFCCYMFLLSDIVFGLLHRIFSIIKSCAALVCSPIRKNFEILKKMVKKLFSNITEWFKIKNIFAQHAEQKQKSGEKFNGREKNKHNCGHRNYCDDSLWHIQSDIES